MSFVLTRALQLEWANDFKLRSAPNSDRTRETRISTNEDELNRCEGDWPSAGINSCQFVSFVLTRALQLDRAKRLQPVVGPFPFNCRLRYPAPRLRKANGHRRRARRRLISPYGNRSDGIGGESRAGSRSRLNSWVAITVALLATFMGICKVKDDNIVQAMQQAQADKLDHWNFYQARNIRQEVAQATLAQLQLAAAARPRRNGRRRFGHRPLQGARRRPGAKKDSLRVQAEADQKTYDSLNYRDDQFDLSDTLIALAISMLALTALTQKRWLFWAAMVPTALGALMGLAGLFGWALHPDSISRLLS